MFKPIQGKVKSGQTTFSAGINSWSILRYIIIFEENIWVLNLMVAFVRHAEQNSTLITRKIESKYF